VGNWNQLKITQEKKKKLSRTPGKHEIKELQNTAILGTEHILREILM